MTRLPREPGPVEPGAGIPAADPARPLSGPRPGGRVRGASLGVDGVLLALLLVLHLVPVWAFPYFASQDGPSHVYNARVMWEYRDPERASLREYFTLNERPEPNLAGHGLLAAPLFAVSPVAAEKLFLSLYVLLLPLAALYALRGIRPESGFLVVLAFPFVYSHSLHMGFYNFVLSLPMFLFVVGFWLRRRDRFGARETLGMAALMVAVYFSHLLSVVMACLAVGALAAWFALLDGVGSAGGRPSWRVVLRSLVVRVRGPFFASVPAVALTAAYVFRQRSSPPQLPSGAEILDRAVRLAGFDGIVSFSKAEVVPSLALVGVFSAAGLYFVVAKLRGARPWSPWDGFLVLVAGFTVLYFLAPEGGLGGGIIAPRLTLFVFLAWLLWLGGQSYSPAMRRGIRVAGVGITVLLFALHWRKYEELTGYYEEYVSAARFVEPNSTLLALTFSQGAAGEDGGPLSWRVHPFLHAAGYVGAAKPGVVVLNNYEARYDYFPVAFRPGRNPFDHIGEVGSPDLDPVDFLTYPVRTGGRVDYVLLWGVREAQRGDSRVVDVYRQLGEGFRPIYRSPRGLAELYRRH